MRNRIRVFFVVPTLYGGGAERVVSYIPQFINEEKFDVTLIVVGLEKDSTYDVSGVSVKFLNKSRVLYSALALFKILFKQKPDIVLSTITHLNVLMGFLSIFFPKIKFIGRHTIVSQTKKKITVKKASFLRRLLRKNYKNAINNLDIVLCQSADMYEDMQINSFEVPAHKLRIIHNPMRDKFKIKPKKLEENGIVKFITVARLTQNKGHERILKAISKLNFPFLYTFIGDGAAKDSIFKLINELGIQDKIKHISYTSEVEKYLANSDYFLMGSYAEGFPNSLIESCSVGTPVIAYKAPGGLNEIIEKGVNGYLVENEAEFLEKIKLSISQDWDSHLIRESVYKKYNKDKIINDYEQLFEEIVN